MQVGGDDAEDAVVSAINTTPLVDVMLVLLIIFLITIPVAIQVVPLELPNERSKPNETKPENVILAVDAEGDIFWNMTPIKNNAELVDKLKEIAVQDPQPEVHIRGDKSAKYESVGRIVFACQRAGIMKVGFVTEPPPNMMAPLFGG
jgi:biopolymer transport protein ExbD